MALTTRRSLLAGSLAAPALVSLLAGASARAVALQQGAAVLERRHGGRLGVAVLDTAHEIPFAHRGEQRFAMCSTFKFLAAAYVLTRADRKEESLSRRVTYTRDDLVAYSPVSGKHVADGLTVGELCEAAITLSDNGAANLILDSFGGPAGLTAYARSLGDGITRLDRRETELNEATPGDPRDTTTPLAMLENLRRTVLGTALSAASRQQLVAWLVGCKTGDKLLRAGVPQGWRVGDKTGAGGHNARNDIAVIWPPDRAPIIVTVYYAQSHATDDERNAVLSEIGRLATTL